MEVIDLAHRIHNKIQIYPGDPIPSIDRFLIHEKDYCHVDTLTLGSHTGTHIDAPFHFLQYGQKIDEIPVKGFYSFLPLKVKGSDGSPIRAVFIERERK